MFHHTIVGKTVSQTVAESFEAILNDGHHQESRNGGATALYNTNLVVTNPRCRHLSLNGRTSNIFQLIAETFWVMAGANAVRPYLEFFLPRAANYSDDGEAWHGAYGSRLYMYNQIDDAVKLLAADKFSRRAVIQIAMPELDSKPAIEGLYGKGHSPKDVPCFVAGTRVFTLERAWTNIEDVKVGDRVLSFDNVGKMTYNVVTFSGQTGVKRELVRVTLKEGSSFTCTPEHLIYVRRKAARGPSTYEQIPAKDLKVGDTPLSPVLKCDDSGYWGSKLDAFDNINYQQYRVGSVEVLSVEPTPVYDITVENSHNFVIDAGVGVIVHNCNREAHAYVTPDNEFHLKLIQRSGDAIFGAGSINPFEFTFIQELMYNQLKKSHPELKLGYYTWSVTNYHLYDSTRQQAIDVLESPQCLYFDHMELTGPDFEDNSAFFGELLSLFSYMITCDMPSTNVYTECMDEINKVFCAHGVPAQRNLMFEYAQVLVMYILSKRGFTLPVSYCGCGLSNEYLSAIVNSKFRKFNVFLGMEGSKP